MEDCMFRTWLQKQAFPGYQDYIHIYRFSPKDFVGFYVANALENSYRQTTELMIRGVLLYDGILPRPNSFLYRAEIALHFSEKKAILEDNVVSPGFRRQGIGSQGLDFIKQLVVSSSPCTILAGVKHPIPNTQDEMDKLTEFYRHNGFHNISDNVIVCDLLTNEPVSGH